MAKRDVIIGKMVVIMQGTSRRELRLKDGTVIIGRKAIEEYYIELFRPKLRFTRAYFNDIKG